jgi:pimeloyl-ACP methyl ester carboxylesterase
MELPLADVPEPDATVEPEGFMVDAGGGDRIHFLQWTVPPGENAHPRGDAEPGERTRPGERARPGVVAIHGLAQTAWIWAPIARRLGGPHGLLRVVAMDLRGHGLSDAPTEDGAYDLGRQAEDVVAAAEGSGLLEAATANGDGVVLVGHGFGGIVAATAAQRLHGRCVGLVLVDGGWESLVAATGLDPDEFLRGLDEPPEVMASLDAFLADRRAFGPDSWDLDQDRAARATIVETHAGRVVPSARPHATEAIVRAMFTYDPTATLTAVEAPIIALMAADDEHGSRMRSLAAVSAARVAAGRDPIATVVFGHDGHNLMRYRPREVAAAILAAAT